MQFTIIAFNDGVVPLHSHDSQNLLATIIADSDGGKWYPYMVRGIKPAADCIVCHGDDPQDGYFKGIDRYNSDMCDVHIHHIDGTDVARIAPSDVAKWHSFTFVCVDCMILTYKDMPCDVYDYASIDHHILDNGRGETWYRGHCIGLSPRKYQLDDVAAATEEYRWLYQRRSEINGQPTNPDEEQEIIVFGLQHDAAFLAAIREINKDLQQKDVPENRECHE